MESESAIESRELVDRAKQSLGTQEGVTLLQKALRLNPQNYEAQVLYASHSADSQVRQTMLRSTIESLAEELEASESAELAQLYFATLVQLAETEFEADDFDAAVDIYASLIAMNPMDPGTFRYRVLTELFQKKEFHRGLSFWKNFEYDEITWNLAGALVFHGVGQMDEAREQLDRVHSKESTFVADLFELMDQDGEIELSAIQVIGAVLLQSGSAGSAWIRSEMLLRNP
jgi:tetratricopeptide (TPR) repeat protein